MIDLSHVRSLFIRAGLGLVGVSAAVSVSCTNDTTAPRARDDASLYWQLTLNHHAITLATVAPYDTIQLTATPRSITGAPLTTSARPTFTTSDTAITIDSTGLVRVHGTSTQLNIMVIAQLTVGGATGSILVDTAMINVIEQSSAATVPMAASLMVHPDVGDSAKRAVILPNGTIATQAFAAPFVRTSAGDSIPNAVVRFSSSDPLIADFVNPTQGTVTAVSMGTVVLTAEATVYGKRLTDSLSYTVGLPLQKFINYGAACAGGAPGSTPFCLKPSLPNKLQYGGNLVVSVGANIVWANSMWQTTKDSLDVVFDDTNGVEGLSRMETIAGVAFQPDVGGNIPAFGTITCLFFCRFNAVDLRVRKFTKPGTYHWHSQIQNVSGTIEVKTD